MTIDQDWALELSACCFADAVEISQGRVPFAEAEILRDCIVDDANQIISALDVLGVFHARAGR